MLIIHFTTKYSGICCFPNNAFFFFRIDSLHYLLVFWKLRSIFDLMWIYIIVFGKIFVYIKTTFKSFMPNLIMFNLESLLMKGDQEDSHLVIFSF